MEGDLAAEVEVNLIHAEDEWTPYLSQEDAYKLDANCPPLRRHPPSLPPRQLRLSAYSADGLNNQGPKEARG